MCAICEQKRRVSTVRISRGCNGEVCGLSPSVLRMPRLSKGMAHPKEGTSGVQHKTGLCRASKVAKSACRRSRDPETLSKPDGRLPPDTLQHATEGPTSFEAACFEALMAGSFARALVSVGPALLASWFCSLNSNV